VFGPVGSDGYPKPIFDKVTGDIDPTVAAYWRDHYDLSNIIARDWATLAPKLKGKIHLYVGNGDNYYLTDSVYFAQERLESLEPKYEGTVAYGDRAEHCWNGDPKVSNAYSRLHYDYQYLPLILQRINATAPKGADLNSCTTEWPGLRLLRQFLLQILRAISGSRSCCGKLWLLA